MTQKLAQSLLIAFVMIIGMTVTAQQTNTDTPIGDATLYKVGEIKVTGIQSFNENTVIAFMGIKKVIPDINFK